mmetsp:Transcript_24483/g.28334  ORF Transcript_24483/g.28334 Transcript_24483/m.28334 type:complete len:256 (-) Transcript_24483:29-796(-)
MKFYSSIAYNISMFAMCHQAECFIPFHQQNHLESSITTKNIASTTTSISRNNNDYFGESRDSFMLKEFSSYDDLTQIIQLSAQPLPERPDGIVAVTKYTSKNRQNCISTEDQYESLARDNPATLFLRCYEEYENSKITFAQAQITVFPTYDIYYGGNRVARVEGTDMREVDRLLNMYQLQNSNLDLFSENADNERRLAWGEGKVSSSSATPRTTARFVPGYDWDKDGGAFDEAANKMQDDFENTYGNWLPNMDDK